MKNIYSCESSICYNIYPIKYDHVIVLRNDPGRLKSDATAKIYHQTLTKCSIIVYGYRESASRSLEGVHPPRR